MQKWEYATLAVEGGQVRFANGTPVGDLAVKGAFAMLLDEEMTPYDHAGIALDKFLNHVGQRGWEVVSAVNHGQSFVSGSTSLIVILKRPVD